MLAKEKDSTYFQLIFLMFMFHLHMCVRKNGVTKYCSEEH